jgi:hypothetical protein
MPARDRDKDRPHPILDFPGVPTSILIGTTLSSSRATAGRGGICTGQPGRLSEFRGRCW